MKTRSVERSQEMRAYYPMVTQFLSEPEHATCEFPLGCGERSVLVHHTRGRRGWRLLYVPWWRGSCYAHNALAEEDTGAALACGWLQRIEGVTS